MPTPAWDLSKEPLDRIRYEKRDHVAFITIARPRTRQRTGGS
jgi:hypothetical protein